MGVERDVKSFRDLMVWQRAIQLGVAVYEFTRAFPKEEQYGLCSQLQRAAVSIASNIAEGSGRMSSGEFKQFLGVARGSNYEVQTQMVIAAKVGFGDEKSRIQCEQLSNEVERMLNSLIRSIGSK